MGPLEALVDPEPAQPVASAAEAIYSRAYRSAEQLTAVLRHTAEALEKSAELADQHARRREQAGGIDDGADERRAATRARQAAQRARSRAEELERRSRHSAHDTTPPV